MTTEKQQPPLKLAAKPLINPLTEQDRQALEHVLRMAPQIQDLLHRAHACGLDVADRQAKQDMHTTVAGTMMEHFFPKDIPTGDE